MRNAKIIRVIKDNKIDTHFKKALSNKYFVVAVILFFIQYLVSQTIDFNLPHPFGYGSLHHIIEMPSFVIFGYWMVAYLLPNIEGKLGSLYVKCRYVVLFFIFLYSIINGIIDMVEFGKEMFFMGVVAFLIIGVIPFFVGFVIGSIRENKV